MSIDDRARPATVQTFAPKRRMEWLYLCIPLVGGPMVFGPLVATVLLVRTAGPPELIGVGGFVLGVLSSVAVIQVFRFSLQLARYVRVLGQGVMTDNVGIRTGEWGSPDVIGVAWSDVTRLSVWRLGELFGLSMVITAADTRLHIPPWVERPDSLAATIVASARLTNRRENAWLTHYEKPLRSPSQQHLDTLPT